MRLKRLWWLLAFVAGAIILLLAIIVAWWFITGGRIYAVQTGSMQPAFSPGDVVLTRPLSFEQLRAGQIISYRDASAPNVITTHRVVTVDKQKAIFTTKGDNVDVADLPLPASQLAGEAVMVAPHLGKWLDRLRKPPVIIALFYVPVTVGLALSLNRLWRPSPVYRER